MKSIIIFYIASEKTLQYIILHTSYYSQMKMTHDTAGGIVPTPTPASTTSDRQLPPPNHATLPPVFRPLTSSSPNHRAAAYELRHNSSTSAVFAPTPTPSGHSPHHPPPVPAVLCHNTLTTSPAQSSSPAGPPKSPWYESIAMQLQGTIIKYIKCYRSFLQENIYTNNCNQR